MKKLLILGIFSLIFISGCTTSPGFNKSSNLSWCEEGNVSLNVLSDTRSIITMKETVEMPTGKLVSMCCVKTLSESMNTSSKFCTVNPEEYDKSSWGYTRIVKEETSSETYTYVNNSQVCVQVYNNSVMNSINCFGLE